MNGAKANIIIRCNSCSNKKRIKATGFEPKRTEVIVCNFCPKCEDQHFGEYWEELWYEDLNGNIIKPLDK